jgi:hypothetical protein
MKTYIYNGVEYIISEEEFMDLVNGWVTAKDMFG